MITEPEIRGLAHSAGEFVQHLIESMEGDVDAAMVLVLAAIVMLCSMKGWKKERCLGMTLNELHFEAWKDAMATEERKPN